MNLIERGLSFLGFERKTRKKTIIRGYNAAKIDRLTADWKPGLLSADGAIRYALKTLRARARDLVINNDYARKYLKLCVCNIVGPAGITLQNKAKDGNILDKVANSRIEAQWERWGKNCTTDGMSWLDLQRLVIESVARDGEILVRIVRGYNNDFGFALQPIEADYLDENLNNAKLSNKNHLKMGIEFDAWYKPVAYHLKVMPTSNEYYGSIGGKTERIPADDIVHLFVKERVRQSRGVTWFHTTMTRMHMLGAYEEAELIASRAGASKMGFFETPTGDEMVGDDTEDGKIISEFEPGTFEQLPKGVKVNLFDPSHPVGNFPFFIKTMLRAVSSGLNISYNSLTSDLESVNYSSIRAGSIEERDNWRILQSWFISNFIQPIFENWLKFCLLNDILKPLPAEKFDKFNNPKWQVRGWQWVDPLKDVKANIEAINFGLKTRSQIVAEQGYDLEEVFEGLRQEQELAKQYGLTFIAPANEPTLIIKENE